MPGVLLDPANLLLFLSDSSSGLIGYLGVAEGLINASGVWPMLCKGLIGAWGVCVFEQPSLLGCRVSSWVRH